jgi:predicted nuclease with TOPRIM domain
MNDEEVLDRIKQLMDEEQQLREAHSAGDHPVDASERERLRTLEEALDQCWDLLRQRRAREEFGENPDEVRPRDTETVEKFLQ